MSQDLGLNIQFQGIDKFTEPAKKVASLSDKLAKSLGDTHKEMKAIAGQKALVKQLDKLKPAVASVSQKLDQARDQHKRLHQVISSGGKVTQKQRNEYLRSGKAVQRLSEQLSRKRQQMASSTRKAKEAGIETNKLANAQNKLSAAYQKVEERMKDIARANGKMTAAQDKHDRALARAAQTALVAGGLQRVGQGLTGALTNPTGQAIRFESAMTEVDKFVKGANLPELKKQILDLGKASPLGAEGIAELVAAGGKINLPADKALQFANITEQLSVAFGLSVDDAANSITTIRTGMNLSIAQVQELGDAINFFGDNSSSNAANITEILQRTGSLGLSAGLAKEQVAGLAAVIDGAAPNAEQAATSLKNMLSALTAGDALSSNSKSALNSLGFDATGLADAMQQDASGTIAKVLESINAQDAGVRGSIIETLFGRESKAAVASMVGNLDEYHRVMGLAGNTTAFAGSVAEEYARTAQTSAHRLAVTRARWNNVMIRLGDKLLPVLESITNALVPVIEGLTRFIDQHPTLTKYLVMGAGALGGLALVVAPVITAVAALGAAITYMGLRSRRAALDIATGGADGSNKGRGKKGGRFRRMGRALGGKAGLVGAAIGAVSLGSTLMDDSLSKSDKVAEASRDVGGIGGALGGAAAGAAIGSVVPIVGTALGAAIGGILGSMGGDWLGGIAGDATADSMKNGLLANTWAGDKPVPVSAAGQSTTVANQIEIKIDGTNSDPSDIAQQVRSELEAIDWERQTASRSNLSDNY